MTDWRARLASSAVPALILVGASACSSGPSNDGEEGRPLFAGTRTEHQVAVFECVRDKGVDVELKKSDDGDGYQMAQHSSESPGDVADLIRDCTAEVGFPPPLPSADEDFKEQFEGRVADYECLVAAGFDIPEPPSFAAYLEEARGGGDLWGPWELLQPIPAAALETCPRDADSWWR